VIGFEPQAQIHPFLHATAALNRSPPSAFRLFQCALGGTYGHVGMAATDFWATSSVALEAEGAPTPRVVLSDMVRQDVALLKVDTEGYERHVFDGAGALLRGFSVANIVLEMKTAESRAAIMPLLEQLGYQCFIYTEKYETGMDVPPEHEARLELLQSLVSPCSGDSEDYFFTKDAALVALLVRR
jgi:FkbM family methyltransferase